MGFYPNIQKHLIIIIMATRYISDETKNWNLDGDSVHSSYDYSSCSRKTGTSAASLSPSVRSWRRDRSTNYAWSPNELSQSSRTERTTATPTSYSPTGKKRSYRIKAVNIFDDDSSFSGDSMTISSSCDSMSMSTHSMLSQSSSRKQPSSYSPKTGMKRSYRVKSVSPIDSPPLF